jgi:hypothetical protein
MVRLMFADKISHCNKHKPRAGRAGAGRNHFQPRAHVMPLISSDFFAVLRPQRRRTKEFSRDLVCGKCEQASIMQRLCFAKNLAARSDLCSRSQSPGGYGGSALLNLEFISPESE